MYERIGKFSQDTVLKYHSAGHKVKSGACHCFSLKWCKMILKSQSSLKSQPKTAAEDRMKELKLYVSAIASMQKDFGNKWDKGLPGNADDGFAGVLKLDLTALETTRSYKSSAWNVEKILNEMSGAHLGSAAVISYWYKVKKKEYGHSVAFFYGKSSRSRTKEMAFVDNYAYHFFDPNIGEYISTPEIGASKSKLEIAVEDLAYLINWGMGNTQMQKIRVRIVSLGS